MLNNVLTNVCHLLLVLFMVSLVRKKYTLLYLKYVPFQKYIANILTTVFTHIKSILASYYYPFSQYNF